MRFDSSRRVPALRAGRPRLASLLASTALLFLVACSGGGDGDDDADGGTGPAPATGPAQLRVSASVGTSRLATQALVAVFYVANGGTPSNDVARDLTPEAGGILAARIASVAELASPINFTLDLKPCLDDPRRAGTAAGECAAHTVVVLLRGSNSLPSERPERVTLPAENVLDVRYAPAVALRSGASAAVPEPVAVREVRSVRLTMSDPGLTVGQSLTLGAVALSAHGDTLTGLPVAWSSANAAVARVDASGVVTAVAPGTVTVTAEVSGVTTSTTVAVRACALRGVTVFPTSLAMHVGSASSLAATLDAEACITERGIRWRSGNAGVATVGASGLVDAVAAGETTIYAMAAADTTVAGTVSVRVTAKPEPSVTIRGVRRNGAPADLASLADTVQIEIEARPELESVREVQLRLLPATGAPITLASFANVALPTTWSVTLPTSALQEDGVTPRFRNGAYTLRAELVTASGVTKSSQANARFANADYATVAIAGERQAADAMGQIWHAGAVTVTITPVDYSGTISGGRVTFSGTRSDGATIDHGVTYASSSVQRVTLPVSGAASQSLGFLVVPELRAAVTVARSTNVPVSDVRHAVPFVRVDNQPPVAGSYAFNTQGAGSNWIGSSYLFSGGYTPGTVAGGGNDTGVGRTTVRYEAAPINTNVQSCSASQSGLTFTTVSSGSNLADSPVNGVVPTGPSYCLRLVEQDALGNSVTSYVASVFGVDRSAPVLLGVLAGSTPTLSIFTNPNAAATSTWGVAVRDTLSGIDATPLLYSLRRLYPGVIGASACIVGAGVNCTAVDGPATVTPVLADRHVRIPLIGAAPLSGYYTMSGVVRDIAANASSSVGYQILIDDTAPTMGSVFLPGGLLVGTSVVFTGVNAADDLDLLSINATLTYPAGQFRCGSVTTGMAFDATLTNSVPLVNLPCSFARSLTTSASSLGAKPTAISMRAVDAAGNVSALSSRAIDPVDVQNGSSVAFANPMIGVSSFGTTPSASTVCNPTTTPCSATPSSTSLTATVIGPSGTFLSPFWYVMLYYRSTDGVWMPIGSNTSALQVDNGVARQFHYTVTFDPPASLLPGTTVQVAAVGVTSAGDALMSAPTTINIVNP